MEKLYILIRSDLAPGLQLAQVAHAMRAFTAAHPEADREWYESSNNVAVLAVADVDELTRRLTEAEAKGALVARFHEVDLGGEMTSGSVLGRPAKRLLRGLPLALAA